MRAPRTIVLIVADDLGWGDAGCYSPVSRVPTPALDRLAAGGLRLTHARTPSALCTPSRYALLTGKEHWRTGATRPLVEPYGPPLIEPTTQTLASMLQSFGYRTAALGKWHLGLRYPSVLGGWTQNEHEVAFGNAVDGGPTALGFDHFFGTAGCCTSDPPYAFIKDAHFTEAPTMQAPPELCALPGVVHGAMVRDWDVRAVDDLLVDHAISQLTEHANSRDGPPFMLYMALSAPHNPWQAPEALRGATDDGPRGDMVAWFDRSVGRTLDALDHLQLAHEALVVVTSDHGPQYEQGLQGHRPTGPFKGRKNTVWEGGLRVPYWVRWPGRVPAGATSRVPFVHTDMLATLASLASMPDYGPRVAPAGGMDQSSSWLGGNWSARPPTLFECGGAKHRIGSWAVIDDNWKLIVDVDDDGREGPERLYNLVADPGETHDCARDGQNERAVVTRLAGILRDELVGASWTWLAGPG